MNSLRVSLRQTIGNLRLLGLIYGLTLVLGLLAALPFYNMIKAEDQDSLAFMNLLNGFDFTVFSDFIHRSGRAVSPLMSVGRWLGVLYIFLSIFLTGGILLRFAQPNTPYSAGLFWQGCSHYAGQLLRLFGVTLLFVLVGAGIWLVAGSLVGILLSDTLTERGQFWTGAVFFVLFALTATLLLCIGDYAKVLMVQEDEQRTFRAFGRAGRLVLRNLSRTYGLYVLLIGIGTGLFGLYFLLDKLLPMSNWPTILLMLVIQQALVFARVGLKVWALGTAWHVYKTMPEPVSVTPPFQAMEPVGNVANDIPRDLYSTDNQENIE